MPNDASVRQHAAHTSTPLSASSSGNPVAPSYLANSPLLALARSEEDDRLLPTRRRIVRHLRSIRGTLPDRPFSAARKVGRGLCDPAVEQHTRCAFLLGRRPVSRRRCRVCQFNDIHRVSQERKSSSDDLGACRSDRNRPTPSIMTTPPRVRRTAGEHAHSPVSPYSHSPRRPSGLSMHYGDTSADNALPPSPLSRPADRPASPMGPPAVPLHRLSITSTTGARSRRPSQLSLLHEIQRRYGDYPLTRS